MWFYYYRIRYYDELDHTEEKEEGVLCAESYRDAIDKLELYYGKAICEVRIVSVEHDCEEILPGKDFADVISAIKNHLE